MKNHLIIICLFVLLFPVISHAQQQVEVFYGAKMTPPTLREKGISDAQQNSLRLALTNKMNEYIQYGKLINPDTRKIDRESVTKFKELFTLNAKLFNDLREIPEAYLYDIDGYVGNARNYFTFDGLLFGINSAEITNVEYDNLTNRYTVTVEVSKTVEKFYSEGGEVQLGTRSYDLEMLYTMKADDWENARILTIRNARDEEPAALYTTIYNLSGGAAYGLPMFSETSLFNNARLDGSVDLETSTEFSLGFSWYSNFLSGKNSPKKMLFLVAGVTGYLQDVTGKLNNYSTQGNIPLEGAIYNNAGNNSQVVINQGNSFRVASEVNVEEVQSIMGVRVPIGLGIRVLDKSTSSAFINIQYVAGGIITSSGDLTGTGNYNLSSTAQIVNNQGEVESFEFITNPLDAYNRNDLSLDNMQNAFGIGEGSTIDSEPDLLQSSSGSTTYTISHGIQLSGIFLKDLVDDDPTYGIGVGVHVYFPITDPWENDFSQEKPFLYPNRSAYVDPGVMRPFMESIQLMNVGVTFNIYYKKGRKP